MKIISFVQHGLELRPIEVEINLLPGLPQMQILGWPDNLIKESQTRIKAAIKTQGFEWPTRKKIVVNLRPTHIKKSSRGLDLAIAAAYLWKTAQLELYPEAMSPIYVYGSLSLDGQIDVPEDLDSLFAHPKEQFILTGVPKKSFVYPLKVAEDLQGLREPQTILARAWTDQVKHPPIPDLSFSHEDAKIMSVLALGHHSALFAGPAGSGKTTMAAAMHSLMTNPSEEEFRRMRQIAHWFQRPVEWRPLIQPHHSMPHISMIGGGANLFPGEITRAHGGMLLMDEFLEFHPHVVESLREPIESGRMILTRQGRSVSYPARFQLIGTTNLCPCGDFTPNKISSCNRSLQKCRSYLNRLSGPLLDRFEVLHFSDQVPSNTSTTDLVEIRKKVDQAREFVRSTRQTQRTSNSQLTKVKLYEFIEPFVQKNLMPETGRSHRRELALLRVARSLADLEQSEIIKAEHLEVAAEISVRSLRRLQQSL